MTLDGKTVDSGSTAVILDGQLGTRGDVMETRVVRWGSQQWDREFSSGTGSASVKTRGSGNGPGCSMVGNCDSGRVPSRADSGKVPMDDMLMLCSVTSLHHEVSLYGK